MSSNKFSLFHEFSLKKRIAPENLSQICDTLRKEGKTIGTLNGSFDLLHAGHLQIIYEASIQADVLIVGLNTDGSIRQYKSLDRPIVPLEYRLQMMSALEFVDYVSWFDETTPHAFISAVRPHVHTNGADYGSDCIEAPLVRELGGSVHIAQFVPGLSTSQLIQKIKSL